MQAQFTMRRVIKHVTSGRIADTPFVINWHFVYLGLLDLVRPILIGTPRDEISPSLRVISLPGRVDLLEMLHSKSSVVFLEVFFHVSVAIS